MPSPSKSQQLLFSFVEAKTYWAARLVNLIFYTFFQCSGQGNTALESQRVRSCLYALAHVKN